MSSGGVLAALVSELKPLAHLNFMDLLAVLVSSDCQSFSAEEQGRDVIEECHVVAREGLWLLCSEMLHNPQLDIRTCAFIVLRD